MFEKSNFIVQNNIKSYLKRYKSILFYPFMIGLVIGSIPFFYKSNQNLKIQKLIKEQRKIQIQNQEKLCKNENSEYKKFLSLGFPKTAIEKFNICMKEQ